MSDVQSYYSKSVFISTGDYDSDQSVLGSIVQIPRVQSVNYSINYPITDEGYLDHGGESVSISHNSIDTSISWLMTNGYAEGLVGLRNDGVAGIFSGQDLQRNIYISIESEQGREAMGSSGSAKTVIGLAQSVLSSYSINANVGSFVEAHASFNCLNAYIYNYSAAQLDSSGNYTGSFFSNTTNGTFTSPSPTGPFALTFATGSMTGVFTGTVEFDASVNYLPAVNFQNGQQLSGTFNLPNYSNQYLTTESSRDASGNYTGYFYSNTTTGTFLSPTKTGPFTITFPGASGLMTGVFTGTADFSEGFPISALGGKDILMEFPTGTPFGLALTGEHACYLDSVNVSFDIGRNEMKPLGYSYPSSRPITFPIHVSLSTSAIISSYQADYLQRMACAQNKHSVKLTFRNSCDNLTKFTLALNNLQLEHQDFTSSLTSFDKAEFKWRGVIYSPNDPRSNAIMRSY